MKPLVIRYRKLGDTIMVTPVLQALADTGADGVYTIGERAWEGVFVRHPAVRGNVSVAGEAPSRWELVRAGIQARRFRCDTAIILRFDRRAALAARFAGCKIRAGAIRKPPRLAEALTHNVYDPRFWRESHQVEKYYRVAEAAAGRALPRLGTFYRPVEGAASGLGRLPEAFAVVHVGSGGSNQGWTDAAYAATVEGLRKRGHKVVVSGSEADKATHERTRGLADLDAMGRTDLDALAELFKHARLLVGLDGGATRVASAVGTPVVALSIGFRWAPGQIHPWMSPGVLLQAPRRCAHCSLHRCDHQGSTCVESLSPDLVLSVCDKLMSESLPRRSPSQ